MTTARFLRLILELRDLLNVSESARGARAVACGVQFPQVPQRCAWWLAKLDHFSQLAPFQLRAPRHIAGIDTKLF